PQWRRLLCTFYFLNCLNDLRHYFKSISNNTIICCFKKGCFGIFIDNNNRFTSVHAGEVLDGTRNPYCEVEVRCNGKSGLSNVLMMRSPVYISNGTTTGGGSSKQVG